MRRYVVQASMAIPEWRHQGCDAETYLARTVHETDPSPQPTGLIDSYGTPIMVVEERHVGFVRFPR